MKITQVIKGPLITEKMDRARESFRQYSFVVDQDATKHDVQRAGAERDHDVLRAAADGAHVLDRGVARAALAQPRGQPVEVDGAAIRGPRELQ